jgi:uncharacterized membrane-anchored protein YhcB (DUF1043 family)
MIRNLSDNEKIDYIIIGIIIGIMIGIFIGMVMVRMYG